MKNKLVDFAEWVVISLAVVVGGVLGWIFQHSLKAIGVTFITLEDIIGCYIFGYVIAAVLAFLSILAIDNKFRR